MTNKPENGFTLVELLVSIMLIGIIGISFSEFFTNNLFSYFHLQQDSSNAVELATASERMADVLRSIYGIQSESANSLTAYAYFSPADTYVSQIDYYVSGTKLLASVTPMTANPPTGSALTAQTTTYTILSNYFAEPSVSLFTYYDAGGNVLTPPVSDENSIVKIGVNLAEPASHNSKNGQQLNITVSIRNRETNG